MLQTVKIHMAARYRISKECPEEVLSFFMRSFGCARKVYNLYTDRLYRQLDAAGYTGGAPLPDECMHLPEVTEFKKAFPFLKEADSLALSNVKIAFEGALKRYNGMSGHAGYTERALRRDRSGAEPLSFKGLKGMPKFRSRAKGDFSYTTNCQYPSAGNGLKQPTIRLEGSTLHLPKVKQGIPLRVHRPLPGGAVIKNATVCRDTGGSYYVSIGYEYDREMDMTIRDAVLRGDTSFIEQLSFIGLDYSQQDFYVDSEGRKANCPHYYRKAEEKLAKLQKELGRMVKGSKHYEETLGRIRKLYRKIRDQRKDFAHKESRRLADSYDVVGVEDIDLRAMGGALKLGKNLHDNGFGQFREFLRYKLEQKGSVLVETDRWFASTKRCSCCGHVNPDVKLGVKRWVCPVCGEEHDRDENAAVNIEGEARRIFMEYFRSRIEETERTRARLTALCDARRDKAPSKKKKGPQPTAAA